MATRVAVIGAGAMGRNHARVYSEIPGVDLVGVADVKPQTAEAVAKRYGTCPYTDWVEMLERERPEAVTVAVPTCEHLKVALDVIAHGIHLLIEKPIAFAVDEGLEIISSARRAGVTLMIGHIERFNPAVIALKQHLAVGELGRVYSLEANREGPFPSRVFDVGVVIDLAVHDLDIMRYVTNAEIVRVYAETERRIHSSREDLLSGLVRLSDGTVGTLSVNWLTPTKIRELHVLGEGGMFKVDYLTQDLCFYENSQAANGEWDALRVLRGVAEGRMIRYVVTKKEPLLAEQEHFLAAVRGEASIAVSGLDGLKALELAQAVVTSGIEHRAIDMEEVRAAQPTM